jgi:hypothetical protein
MMEGVHGHHRQPDLRSVLLTTLHADSADVGDRHEVLRRRRSREHDARGYEVAAEETEHGYPHVPTHQDPGVTFGVLASEALSSPPDP